MRKPTWEQNGMSGNRLYIGNLSWNTDEDGLRDAFSEFGEVTEVKVIMDRETGRSRGFAFVAFANANDAGAAIEGMDGKSLDGRSLRVSEAEERPGRKSGGGGGSSYENRRPNNGGGRPPEPEVQVLHRPIRDDGGSRAPRRGPKPDRW